MKKQFGREPDPIDEESGVVIAFPIPEKERQTYHEPYEPIVGAMANVTPVPKAKKKPKPVAAVPLDDDQIAVNRARRGRYDKFVMALIRQGGDQTAALAEVYGLPAEAIQEKIEDFRADIALGMSESSVSDLMEKYNIGKASRIAILAQHVYSPDAKVSLVASKMASELGADDRDHGQGSYEKHLSMVLGKQK